MMNANKLYEQLYILCHLKEEYNLEMDTLVSVVREIGQELPICRAHDWLLSWADDTYYKNDVDKCDALAAFTAGVSAYQL